MDLDLRARATDPGTSKEHVPTLGRRCNQDLVLSALQKYGKLNSKDLAEVTGIDRVSVSPMLKPMERKGLIVCTGEKRDGGLLWALPTIQRSLF